MTPRIADLITPAANVGIPLAFAACAARLRAGEPALVTPILPERNRPVMEVRMPNDASSVVAGDSSSHLMPNMGQNPHSRKILAQSAVVAALRAAVNRAIVARDDLAGQSAHEALVRAEWRLMRMEAVHG